MSVDLAGGMSLNGYVPTCGKTRGGISAIELADAGSVRRVEFDPQSGCCAGIALDDGVRFARYEFAEGEAFYTEEGSGSPGRMLITHRLGFTLELTDMRSAEAIERMCAASGSGIVAIVTQADGTRLLAGYSPRFGAAYPLRVAESISTCGTGPGDTPYRKVTFVCRDTQHARELLPSAAV